jgi:hypothetical protein
LSYSVCDACNVEILAGWLDAQITRRDPDSGVCEYCRHGKYQVKAPRPGFLEPLMMYGGGSIGEAHHPGVLLCRECILRVVRAVIMRERYGP